MSEQVPTGHAHTAPPTLPPPGPREQRRPLKESTLWRHALLRRMLAVADLASALVAVGVLGVFEPPLQVWAVASAPVWLLLAKLYGLYDADHRTLRHLTVDETPALLLWSLTGTALTAIVVALAAPAVGPSLAAVAFAWPVAALSAFVLRAVARIAWRRRTPPDRTLVIGDAAQVRSIRRKLELFPDIHAAVVEERSRLDAAGLAPGRGGLAAYDRIVAAPDAIDDGLLGQLVIACRRERIKLSVVPPVHAMLGTAVQLTHVADLSVVEYNTWDVSRSTLLLKRLLDVVVAFVALVVLAPLFALVALTILLREGRPVFFTQVRASAQGRPFRMFKFRTMATDAEAQLPRLVAVEPLDAPALKLRDDPRVTGTGGFLRRFSLDELPQLANVLRGDMSLVGPRPEQIEFVELYRPEDRFRLTVKPGLTGPMQVYGRGQLTFEERLALEREYVENLSLRRDLKLIVLTLSALASGKGAF